jgi:protein involved in polysaccharide export with SLBB domain
MKVLLAVLSLAGVLAAGGPSPAAPAPTPVGERSAVSDYRLGPGDKLQVSVFDVPTLGGEFQVPGTGKISFPLIGETRVDGLTIQELQVDIERALGEGYVKDPHVSVQVTNYRPFFILGEVNKPGEYPFTDRLTVLNAVAEAGGFTYRANARVFRRRHTDDRGEVIEPLTADTLVEPGDTIRIQERWF